MKRPGDTTPAPPGGRVAARLRMYEEQRGSDSGSPIKTKAKKRKKTKKTKKTR
jgi:hypothetical protein